jgi:TetR/AcrR family transcriptional regulator
MARKPKKSARSRRQPGRPPREDRPHARDALLDAASRLFAQHGATEVSLRRVASEAGVTPAMVHYYFGGKEGLYDALLERTFARIVERVRAVADRSRNSPADFGEQLGDLLGLLMGTFAAEPWVPTLVVREVLAEGGRFRERFIRDYASHMADLLPGLMRREIEAGRFRADLDPVLAFVSFMGMTLMPFVARPVLEQVLGIDYGEDFLSDFAAHTRRLFVEGARS